MAKKKYDPLWEIVGEKNPLQGQEADVDAHCPHCHVKVHLGVAPKAGTRITCGLCGGVSTIVAVESGAIGLDPVFPEEPPA